MAKIVKLQAKQAVNNALYHRNGPNTTLVHDLLLNSEVFIQCKSGNWNGLYRLLAVKNKTCYVQLLSGPTRFRNIFVKPYFWPKNTYDIKLDELEVIDKLDKLEAPAKLDNLEVFPFTLEVPKELIKPIELIIKRSQGRPQKHLINKNPIIENHITSAGISAKIL